MAIRQPRSTARAIPVQPSPGPPVLIIFRSKNANFIIRIGPVGPASLPTRRHRWLASATLADCPLDASRANTASLAAFADDTGVPKMGKNAAKDVLLPIPRSVLNCRTCGSLVSTAHRRSRATGGRDINTSDTTRRHPVANAKTCAYTRGSGNTQPAGVTARSQNS